MRLRQTFLLAGTMVLVFAFVICFPSIASASQAAKKPNFVIIMADDLGYGDISPFDGWIKTPVLERMAKEGMKLTDFHSSGAVCSPTRAGLLTGRYQQRAGIPGVVFADPNREEHTHGLQPREHTFAELLRQAGYATGIVGKWHLGYYPKYNPVRHGFDFYRGYVSGNIDFFSHIDQAGNFDWWQQDKKKDEEGYVTHLITKHSAAFIEKNKNKPFCLYIAHEAPHYPYQGPNDKALRVEGKPRTKNELNMTAKEKTRAYREMVQEMDKSIGKVLEVLRENGLEENTFVFFFSDNGATRLGSNGRLRGSKGTVWEGGHRIPAIARWPERIPAGSVNSSLGICLDVLPTMLSFANAEGPKNHQFDGIDLSEILTKNETISGRKLFWQHGKSTAMREGPWSLVKNVRRKNKTIGLYHLGKDIGQKKNLAKAEPKRLERMLSEMNQWQKEVRMDATPQP